MLGRRKTPEELEKKKKDRTARAARKKIRDETRRAFAGKVQTPQVADLATAGLTVDDRGAVRRAGEKEVIAVVTTARSGRVTAVAQPIAQVRRITSSRWLELVRARPCSFCAAPPPSQPNHYPGRGRAGGGSDLETHPICNDCHRKATAHQISDEAQASAVVDAVGGILRDIRLGLTSPIVLLEMALEVVANREGRM